MKEKDQFLGYVGIIALGLLLTIISIILNAWALKILWGWFFTPFGLPYLSIMQAAGISVVINFLIRGAINRPDEDVNWYKAIADAIISPLFSVGLGWILLQFT